MVKKDYIWKRNKGERQPRRDLVRQEKESWEDEGGIKWGEDNLMVSPVYDTPEYESKGTYSLWIMWVKLLNV